MEHGWGTSLGEDYVNEAVETMEKELKEHVRLFEPNSLAWLERVSVSINGTSEPLRNAAGIGWNRAGTNITIAALYPDAVLRVLTELGMECSVRDNDYITVVKRTEVVESFVKEKIFHEACTQVRKKMEQAKGRACGNLRLHVSEANFEKYTNQLIQILNQYLERVDAIEIGFRVKMIEVEANDLDEGEEPCSLPVPQPNGPPDRDTETALPLPKKSEAEELGGDF
jgi:hypothetical protein